MAKNYKLTEEIKEFIIHQKMLKPDLSCRAFVKLIQENFAISLSKSLINNVLKENKLSMPIGRKGVRETKVVQPPSETKILQKESGFIDNGGYFFLKAADLKFALTSRLAEYLAPLFPAFALQQLQLIIEASAYSPIFTNKNSLWMLIGKEVPSAYLEQYSARLVQIPLEELNSRLVGKIIVHNLNKRNELHQTVLLRLNTYVQIQFFPSVYKILDFPEMGARFYSLPAQIEKKQNLVKIQLFYPSSFSWKNDVVWQEDLSYASQRVNKAEIFTPQREQVWISPLVKPQDEKAVTSS